MIWGMLQDKLRRDNPQITTWNWQNFAIGGSNETGPLLTGTALGITTAAYPWFTDLSQTWFSYVQAAAPDVLFWLFGTNGAASGETPTGVNASTFIRLDFEAIEAWAKQPNIVIITTKSANPATDNPAFDDANSSAHKGQASFHRTFAQSVANGYTSFPKTRALGFGLVDLGRYFTARIDGHDPASQGLQSVPSSVVNGKPIIDGDTVGVTANTLGLTTHGDFRVTFVLPNGGGGAWQNFDGGDAMLLSAGQFAANYLRFNFGAPPNGNVIPRYTLDGSISGPPSIVGTTVATAAGNVTITVSMVGSRIQCWVNATLALDIMAPRFVSEKAGGTPINLVFATPPTGSPVVNVTEFYEGIGVQTNLSTNYGEAFGIAGGASHCGSGDTECQGGNSINHQRTNSAATDRLIIDSLDFRVPQNGWLTDLTAGKLYFVAGGTSRFSIDASGNVRAAGTITGSVTP
jgi:hypothetical protein